MDKGGGVRTTVGVVTLERALRKLQSERKLHLLKIEVATAATGVATA